MKTNRKANLIFLMCMIVIPTGVLIAQQQYYVSINGSDLNKGDKENPLKTINEGIKRINSDSTKKSAEIIVAPGRYVLTETVLIKNSRLLNSSERLIIKAEILPDDKQWMPEFMPTIVTAIPLVKDQIGETANGIQVEVSHVTIQGFRFLGGLDFENKDTNQLRRSYPIWRGGKNLDDLVVSQCVFMGDSVVMPLHVGIIANGHGLVVEHCIFYKCKNPVVFWTAEGGTSYRNAMRNCIVYGSSFSAVWTVQTNGDDFDFSSNIITKSSTVWIRERNGTRKYTVRNCMITDNNNWAGYGFGPLGKLLPTAYDFLTLDNVMKNGNITLDMNRNSKYFLHVEQNDIARKFNAGLFSH